MTKLTDLIGLHTLSGFDTSIPDKENLEDGVCFVLDDKKYQIYTDPDDGWRSYLSELFEEDIECRNMIPPELVLIVEKEKENKNYDGILIYSSNSKVIADISTDNSDDWYPCARCEWYPENLSSNNENNDIKNLSRYKMMVLCNNFFDEVQLYHKSQKPIGKLVKSFIGTKSGYPIDVYYDETVDGLDYWSSVNNIYQRIFNNCLNSYSVIDDCRDVEDSIYKEIKKGEV